MVAGQTRSGGARLSEHGWAALFDVYEPYILLREMFRKNDEAHLTAMQKMRELMKTPDSEAMKNWLKSKREEFDALPADQ